MADKAQDPTGTEPTQESDEVGVADKAQEPEGTERTQELDEVGVADKPLQVGEETFSPELQSKYGRHYKRAKPMASSFVNPTNLKKPKIAGAARVRQRWT